MDGANRDGALERARAMYDLYSRGATLEGVGRRYGLTRERVRQIFRDAGYPQSR